MEEWRDVTGYEGMYKVSNEGRVFSVRKNRVMNNQYNGNYYHVMLCNNGSKEIRLVHRLVANEFVGSVDGVQVNHIDGVKTNNDVENLELCNASQNAQHSCRVLGHKTPCYYGENHPKAVLTREIVDGVRLAYAEIRSERKVAKMFGVSRSTVNIVLKGVSWFDKVA